MQYFNRKEELKAKAKLHEEMIRESYSSATKESAENSKVFTGCYALNKISCSDGKCISYDVNDEHCSDIVLFKGTTSDAVFKYAKTDGVTALNFASYKNPGGMYLNGSSAQEESLCHDSNLYSVISVFQTSYYEANRSSLNRGLYSDRAIYSPDIYFMRGDVEITTCNILTCAAPNKSLLYKYNSFTEEENSVALKERIKFMHAVLSHEDKAKTLILGAWGCGVFKQDVEEVITILLQEFAYSKYDSVIIAIPDDKTYNRAAVVLK